jgi:hypothetical protein
MKVSTRSSKTRASPRDPSWLDRGAPRRHPKHEVMSRTDVRSNERTEEQNIVPLCCSLYSRGVARVLEGVLVRFVACCIAAMPGTGGPRSRRRWRSARPIRSRQRAARPAPTRVHVEGCRCERGGVHARLLDWSARDRRVAEGTWVLTVQLEGVGEERRCRAVAMAAAAMALPARAAGLAQGMEWG